MISILKSGKDSRKRPDPVPRGQRNLAVGDFVQHVKVAVVDRLVNQTADKELVLLGGHSMPRFCLRGDCRLWACAP
jgi:hypothetical protein